MNSVFSSQADLKKIRDLGLYTAKKIYEDTVRCGHAAQHEGALWEAYLLGYEAGKKHEQKVKESGRKE